MLAHPPFPSVRVAMVRRVACLLVAAAGPVFAADPPPLTHDPAEISAGGEMNLLMQRNPLRIPLPWEEEAPPPQLAPSSFAVGSVLEAYAFTDNSTLNDGFLFIPPDPMGAAGFDRLIAVVNVGIECRLKNGSLLWRSGLKNFFAPLGGQTLGTYTFDPKIVYDYHENRFVVLTLEQTSVAEGEGADASRILVAVSKTSAPETSGALDWWYFAIDSNIRIGGGNYWADYPGLEVDEEAVYITANLFRFTTNAYGGVRLWILEKGVSGGFYAGGAPVVDVYNPIPQGASGITTMPAQVWGASGAGPGIGTYLVGYDGLTQGGVERVQVIRVDDPLGSPSFTLDQPGVGDIEDTALALPDAPQSGGSVPIEVNNRRALDAVWRDGALWFTATLLPTAAHDPANAGQATGHWFKLDTSAVTSSASPAGLITLADQGNLGGEDIASGTTTFYPAVAVNSLGEAHFGFSASAPTIFAGAYMAARLPGDPPGTVGPTRTVRAGTSYYVRTFGGTRNRWGDYSGIAVDPLDERIFWVFNEYAWTQGTPTSGEVGRWRCAWRSAALSCLTVDCPGDTAGYGGENVGRSFCLTNCGALAEVMSYSVTDEAGWCAPLAAGISVPAGQTVCIPVTCAVPPGACPGDSTVITLAVTSPGGAADTCTTVVRVVNTAPVVFCMDLDLTGSVTAPCSVAVLPGDVDAGSVDPDGDPLTLSLDPPGPFPEGATPVQLIATDPCGLSDTCSAVITVTCPIGPRLSVDPAGILIPAVALGDTACRAVVVRNTGDQPLQLLSVTGCDAGQFFLDATGLPGTIDPGDSTGFLVCFAPVGGGADSCQVTVATGDSTAVIPVRVGTVTAIAEDAGARPHLRAAPNPFEASVAVRFGLAVESPVRLEVFDAGGRRVRMLADRSYPAGNHEVRWDGKDSRGGEAARGMYFIRLEAGEAARTVRAVKLR